MAKDRFHGATASFGISRQIWHVSAGCKQHSIHFIVIRNSFGGDAMAFEDILYEKQDGVATITINRPKVLNAFRAETVEEMLAAMRDADNDDEIGVIVMAGAGDRAFCSGGDNSSR